MFNKILFLFLIIFYNVTNASIDEAIQNKAIEISYNMLHIDPITKKANCPEWISNRSGKFSDSIRVQILDILQQLKQRGDDTFLNGYVSPRKMQYTPANYNFVGMAHCLSDI